MELFKNRNSLLLKMIRYMILSGFVAEISSFLQMVTDNVVSSHVIGFEGLQVTTLMLPFTTVNALFSMLLCGGGELMYAKYIDSDSDDMANKEFSLGLLVSFCAGIVFFLFMLVFKPFFLRGLDVSADIIANVSDYYDIYKYVTVFNPVFYYLSVLIYYDGDSFLYAFSSLIQVAANFILSILLGYKYGAKGVAIGTLISVIICLVTVSFHFLKKSNSLRFRKYFSLSDCISIFSCVLPNYFECLGWILLPIVFTPFVLRVGGAAYIGIVTILMCISDLMTLYDCVLAVIPAFTIPYYNDGCEAGIRKAMFSLLKIAVGVSLILTMLLLLFPQLVLSLYNLTDSEVASDMIVSVRIFSLFLIPAAVYSIFSEYYLALGKRKIVTIFIIMKNIVLPIGLGLAFGELFGLTMMQIGITLGNVLAGAFGLLIIKRILEKNGENVFALGDMETGRCYFLEYRLTKETISQPSLEMDEIFKKEHVDMRCAFRCELLVDCMAEKLLALNKRSVLIEIILNIGDDIRLTLRDDGISFDLSKEDDLISSFNDFVLYRLLDIQEEKRYYTRLSNNSVKFVFNGKDVAHSGQNFGTV